MQLVGSGVFNIALPIGDLSGEDKKGLKRESS